MPGLGTSGESIKKRHFVLGYGFSHETATKYFSGFHPNRKVTNILQPLRNGNALNIIGAYQLSSKSSLALTLPLIWNSFTFTPGFNDDNEAPTVLFCFFVLASSWAPPAVADETPGSVTAGSESGSIGDTMAGASDNNESGQLRGIDLPNEKGTAAVKSTEPADTKTAEPDSAKTVDTKTSPPKTPKSAPVTTRKHAGTAFASFALGAIVGTPVAIVRRTVAETIAGNQDIIRDSTNPILVIPATIITLPFSVPAGACEGVYRGVKNSWLNSSKNPFSKDAFSLGEMD